MQKRNLLSGIAVLAGICVMTAGCGKEKDNATPDTAAANTPVPTNTATPAPTATPTPEPASEPSDEWVYRIVQDGYYNAAAEWDEDENPVSYPEAVIGEYIYYNDCDEYYNNFVHPSNVFNGAKFSLDDDIRHSGDNSIKITGRESETNGFSGFALRFSEENALPAENYSSANCTLGFWVYYQDDFNNGISDEFTFCVWSNTDRTLDPVSSNATEEPAEDATEDEKNLYKMVKAENDDAAETGFSKLATVTVPKETWTYVEVPFSILPAQDSQEEDGGTDGSSEPMLVIATLGENNSANITYYNPFYLDDITVTYNGTAESGDSAGSDGSAEE